VDRLTRSLADFARIVEVLDRAGSSFVSVTQAFNTTTSMGRLTLNVLLSFAQFEREVTGERIRDKIAASKAKGMWMGGPVPLGYDLGERRLLVNEAEATTVRLIFRRYLELGSTGALVDELDARGVVTKRRQFKDGREVGGQPFERGALAHLLKNCVYVGDISHRGKVYAGEHPPIVGREVWEGVQVMMAANTRERRATRAAEPSLLAGRIRDGLGRMMTPSHANRGTRRYRYYVSRTGGPADPNRVWSLPARALEQAVLDRLGAVVGAGEELTQRIGNVPGETLELIRNRSNALADQIGSGRGSFLTIVRDLDLWVQVYDTRISVTLDPEKLLLLALGPDAVGLKVELSNSSPLEFTVNAQFRRRGQELRLVFRPGDSAAPVAVDAKLVELIAKAHDAYDQLADVDIPVASSERPHLTRLARLKYLAPDISSAILAGQQPADLCARKLLRIAQLPLRWDRQREHLGSRKKVWPTLTAGMRHYQSWRAAALDPVTCRSSGMGQAALRVCPIDRVRMRLKHLLATVLSACDTGRRPRHAARAREAVGCCVPTS
jgi:site-specific DNA recombinase